MDLLNNIEQIRTSDKRLFSSMGEGIRLGVLNSIGSDGYGDCYGCVDGDCYGDVDGDCYGDVDGDCYGDVDGDCYGCVDGDCYGDVDGYGL